MAIYTIFRKAGAPREAAVFVKEGFSIAAFVLTFVWALWNRMWVVAAVILAVTAAVAVAGSLSAANDVVVTTVNAGLALIFGFEEQSLRAWSLRRSGFVDDGLVEASSREEAEMKYFAAALPAERVFPRAAPVRSHGSSQSDPLGLFGNV
jgi:hypothetical protein